jgi:ABC-type Zn uptake system ZnuABC Zn-binding protein ZnuA
MCNSNKRKCNTCVINVDLTINIKCLRLDTAVVNNARWLLACKEAFNHHVWHSMNNSLNYVLSNMLVHCLIC